MKYFAKLDDDNLVTQVVKLNDDQNKDFLEQALGGNWVETYRDGSVRKNFAGIGMTYDSELDAFIPPKPFDSWVLDEETAQWEAPVEYPTDGKDYVWNEETISWDEVPESTD